MRVMVVLMFLVACGDEVSQAPPARVESPETSMRWASVSAGWRERNEREDWCAEHQVPESACTRCNPELRAEFQARGDWCDEHDLPMSQCREHSP